MFGISFPEMTIILVIAVIALGPEKLPKALVEIAKYFKIIKKAVNDAKTNFEQEVKIAELKEDAKKYKDSIENAAGTVRKKLTFEELDEIKKNLNSAKDSLNKGLDDLQKDLNSAVSNKNSSENSAENSNENLQNENSEQNSQTKNSQSTQKVSENQSAIDKLNSANFDDDFTGENANENTSENSQNQNQTPQNGQNENSNLKENKDV